jgi:hypothetical protein
MYDLQQLPHGTPLCCFDGCRLAICWACKLVPHAGRALVLVQLQGIGACMGHMPGAPGGNVCCDECRPTGSRQPMDVPRGLGQVTVRPGSNCKQCQCSLQLNLHVYALYTVRMWDCHCDLCRHWRAELRLADLPNVNIPLPEASHVAELHSKTHS